MSTSIRVRFTPAEKRRLEAMADRVGVTFAEALRRGAHDYLAARADRPGPESQGG